MEEDTVCFKCGAVMISHGALFECPKCGRKELGLSTIITPEEFFSGVRKTPTPPDEDYGGGFLGEDV